MLECLMDINEVTEIRARTTIYFGYGAIEKMRNIAADFAAKGIRKVMVISTPSAYKVSGAWEPIQEALAAEKIEYQLYDKVTPNPDTVLIDEATAQAKQFGAQAVIGIGGGSPIDTAKSVAVLVLYPDKTAEELYEWKFAPEKALPIVAVNLTHGTGSEGNRVAVASILSKQFKPAIAYDCLYPTWSIDDPGLMLTLPPKQILYTSIDAVNHAIEAATSTVTNPMVITMAREVVKLVVKNLPAAIRYPDNKTARYNLAYAALLGGIAFDNGFLHITHALEHPLSARHPELTHGLGLAILLPAVLRVIYPYRPDVLGDILYPMVPRLYPVVFDTEKAASGVEDWLFAVGADLKLSDVGFSESEIPELTDLVFNTPSLNALLAVSPAEVTRETVETIFRDSFQCLEWRPGIKGEWDWFDWLREREREQAKKEEEKKEQAKREQEKKEQEKKEQAKKEQEKNGK